MNYNQYRFIHSQSLFSDDQIRIFIDDAIRNYIKAQVIKDPGYNLSFYFNTHQEIVDFINHFKNIQDIPLENLSAHSISKLKAYNAPIKPIPITKETVTFAYYIKAKDNNFDIKSFFSLPHPYDPYFYQDIYLHINKFNPNSDTLNTNKDHTILSSNSNKSHTINTSNNFFIKISSPYFKLFLINPIKYKYHYLYNYLFSTNLFNYIKNHKLYYPTEKLFIFYQKSYSFLYNYWNITLNWIEFLIEILNFTFIFLLVLTILFLWDPMPGKPSPIIVNIDTTKDTISDNLITIQSSIYDYLSQWWSLLFFILFIALFIGFITSGNSFYNNSLLNKNTSSTPDNISSFSDKNPTLPDDFISNYSSASNNTPSILETDPYFSTTTKNIPSNTTDPTIIDIINKISDNNNNTPILPTNTKSPIPNITEPYSPSVEPINPSFLQQNTNLQQISNPLTTPNQLSRPEIEDSIQAYINSRLQLTKNSTPLTKEEIFIESPISENINITSTQASSSTSSDVLSSTTNLPTTNILETIWESSEETPHISMPDLFENRLRHILSSWDMQPGGSVTIAQNTRLGIHSHPDERILPGYWYTNTEIPGVTILTRPSPDIPNPIESEEIFEIISNLMIHLY